jgi:hypothetical protein
LRGAGTKVCFGAGGRGNLKDKALKQFRGKDCGTAVGKIMAKYKKREKILTLSFKII